MSRLPTLPDISFTDYEAEAVTDWIFGLYEKFTGRKLADGDPVRLFLLTIIAVIIQLLALIDNAGKMNLLAFATGGFLDHLGSLVGCWRIPATAATTMLQFSLSESRAAATLIPVGTRATAGDGVYFATDTDLVIPAGSTFGSVRATAAEASANGNGYQAGEITTIVDPIPFVESVMNTTLSEGGADQEADEDFRLRIEEAPEKFSVAGSSGAYRYHAMSASSLIADAYPYSPAPGEVDVVILLKDGELPGAEIIAAVEEQLSADTVRPLTDHVTVSAPTVVDYDIELTYYIDTEDETSAAAIREAVEAAVAEFAVWTRSKLGRDINSSKLYSMVKDAGAKWADIASPVKRSVVEKNEVAIARNINVTFGGFEDG